MSTPSLTLDGQEPFATQQNLEDTLRAVCEAAVKLVALDHSGLVLFSNDYEYGTVVAEYPPSPLSVVGKQFPIKGVKLEEDLVHSRRPLVVPNVATEDSLGVVQKVLLDMGVKSLVVVPIIVDDQVKGSFSFDSINEVREFQNDDIEKCVMLGKFGSLVIKNAHLLNNLLALRRAMMAIASELERVPLLQAITREAVNLVQAQGGGIDELDERKGELTIVAQFNMPEEIVGKTMMSGEGLAGQVIQRNLDHMTVPNYIDWPGKAPYFRDKKFLESVIGVPLRLNNQPTGVLWLNSPMPREYSRAEIELLNGLAAPASIALQQTALKDDETRRASRLQALARATNDIFVNLATSTRQERLTLIAQRAHEIIDAELCGILLVEKPGWLKLEAGDGYRKDRFERGKTLEILPGPGTGLTGYIAWSGEIFSACGEALSNHPARAHKGSGADYSPSGECFSLLGIPLKTEGGELKGLISINNKNDKDGKPNQWTCFTEDDKAIGGIFAQAALVAIETADLQDRYKTLAETSDVLALTKVPEDGLGALAKMVLREIDKSFCRILFFHEVDQTIQVIAAEKASGKKGAFKWLQRLGEKTNVETWEGLADSLKSGEFVVQRRGDGISDINLDQLSKLIELRDLEDQPLKINYMLRSPLKVNERIIGLLLIGETDPAADFSQFELDLAQIIATQASRLIERLEWNKKILLDLFATERAITASNDANAALKLVAAQVYEVGRAYGRKVTVVNINVCFGNNGRVVAAFPEEQLEVIRSIVGDPFELRVGPAEERRLGLVGKVCMDGTPIMESDVRGNPNYINIHNDTLSQLVVPIKKGDEIVGAISVESSEASAFDEQDLMLVEGIAIQASSALSKEKDSREYKKVRTVALAGAAAQLWRHGLKDRAKLIMGKIDDAIVHRREIEMPAVLASIREDARYIEHFRFIPLSSEEGVADEILNNVLQNYLESFHDSLEFQGLDVSLLLKLEQTNGRKVRINRDWFQKALSIFLENARAAVATAIEKRIQVETELLEHSRCRILISNTGAKIRDDIWEKMTNERIVRADGNAEKGGGLLLADLITAVYGGKLEKLNNQSNNIVIGITLPLVS
jgi:GAF domain-containing protein